MSETAHQIDTQDERAPHMQTSLRWDVMETVAEVFDQVPVRMSRSMGTQNAIMAGLIGIIAVLFLGYHLVLQPLHTLPFGAPYIHTPQTAQQALPGSRLAKLAGTKHARGSRYITTYLSSYFIPKFFSTSGVKQADLALIATRSLLLGLLMLLCVRLYFTDEPEEAPADSQE